MRCEACWRAQFAFASPRANRSVVRRDASTLTPRSANVFYGWRPDSARLHPHGEIRVEPIPGRTRIVRGKLCRACTAICWPDLRRPTPTQGNIPLPNRVRSRRQALCCAGSAYGFTLPSHRRADLYPAEIAGVWLGGSSALDFGYLRLLAHQHLKRWELTMSEETPLVRQWLLHCG